MIKKHKRQKDRIYFNIAYAAIALLFFAWVYAVSVPFYILKNTNPFPEQQIILTPLVTPPPSPRAPTPTPEALMGHKTYASEKLNLKFEYATKIKAGTKIIPLRVSEIGNIIYVHDADRGPDILRDRYIEVTDRNFRETLEDTVKKIFIEKPQYCRIVVSKTDERKVSAHRFDLSEIARIQAKVATSTDNGVDSVKSELRRKICGYNSGFFTFDQKHPDKLLFIRSWGLNGNDPVLQTFLYSNIIEDNKNLPWESTIEFIR